MNETARKLSVDRKTVARKMRFLGKELKRAHQRRLQDGRSTSTEFIQFDEMRSFEHTKLKPVTIALAVDDQRRIIWFKAGKMAADGPLAEFSRKKYGPRKDECRVSVNEVLLKARETFPTCSLFLSDEKSFYPTLVEAHFPGAKHKRYKGRRGAVTGQGELKKGGRDPLFKINHSCAKFRAYVARLIRSTWNTTKKIDCLEDHLWIYVTKHNRRIEEALVRKERRRYLSGGP